MKNAKKNVKQTVKQNSAQKADKNNNTPFTEQTFFNQETFDKVSRNLSAAANYEEVNKLLEECGNLNSNFFNYVSNIAHNTIKNSTEVGEVITDYTDACYCTTADASKAFLSATTITDLIEINQMVINNTIDNNFRLFSNNIKILSLAFGNLLTIDSQ
ncbi:MAG: hypothetical protein J0H68_08985 [Sphingobacteriia bacterium]|nr:hypothetical protein [Sphingobacteriia bacterium]